jgi:CBS domain-containing protein
MLPTRPASAVRNVLRRHFSPLSGSPLCSTFRALTEPVSVSAMLARKPVGSSFMAVSANTAATNAIRHMAPANVGSVAVCEDRKVVGIFTERDYVAKIGVTGRSQTDLLVKDLMSANPVVITKDATLQECVATMFGPGRSSFRHLPVVESHDSKVLVDMIRWRCRCGARADVCTVVSRTFCARSTC